MDLLKGKLALVTGGAGGIGRAIAKAFVASGANVIVTDIDGQASDKCAEMLRAGGGAAWSFKLDVTDLDGCAELAARVRTEIGPISILVNNAGITGENSIDDEAARELWDRQLAVNLTGPFNVTKAFVPALRETKGCIINLASMVSFTSMTASYGYVATKGGVRSLTQTMARELAADGIRVNAVAPGVIETAMTAKRRANGNAMDAIMLRTPMKRIGAPEEVAWPVVFLASSMASYVTGITMPIDGGFLAV